MEVPNQAPMPPATSTLEGLHPDLLIKVAGMLPFADRRASVARLPTLCLALCMPWLSFLNTFYHLRIFAVQLPARTWSPAHTLALAFDGNRLDLCGRQDEAAMSEPHAAQSLRRPSRTAVVNAGATQRR